MDNGDKKRKTIAVLFGGRSVEHEISIITGLQVIQAMDVVNYNPIPVYIAPTGKWYAGAALLNREFYKNMPTSLSKAQEVALLPVPNLGGLTVLRGKASSKFNFFAKAEEELIPVDTFFLAFHGSYGEDGCMQGLLEMADAAYTGCDVLASALSMSKYHCKKVVEAHGVPVLPSIQVSREAAGSGLGTSLSALREQIMSTPGLQEFPLFVKPATLGSSIGVSKAEDAPGLDAALLKAFKYDISAIVEPCLVNKLELNVSVIEAKKPIASVVEIPVPAAGAELTYEDKYLRGGGKKTGSISEGMAGLTRVIDPQDLKAETKCLAQELAVKAYSAIGCSGVARIDFMQDLSDGTLYFNEINPIPGSFAFYLWEKSQPPILFTDMITLMIENAQARKQRRNSLTREIGFQALFK